jgi:hypothetical protein
LLSFGAESLVFQFNIKKCKDYDIQNYIILVLVLYGCETWSCTLREECRLTDFGNRVLRKIFGPKRHEVTGEWRRLHNKELYIPYFSPKIIQVIKSRRLRWVGHVARMRGEVHTKERDQLKDQGADWRIRLKWIFEKWDWGMDWIDLAQGRDRWRAVVNTVMKLQVP